MVSFRRSTLRNEIWILDLWWISGEFFLFCFNFFFQSANGKEKCWKNTSKRKNIHLRKHSSKGTLRMLLIRKLLGAYYKKCSEFKGEKMLWKKLLALKSASTMNIQFIEKRLFCIQISKSLQHLFQWKHVWRVYTVQLSWKVLVVDFKKLLFCSFQVICVWKLRKITVWNINWKHAFDKVNEVWKLLKLCQSFVNSLPRFWWKNWKISTSFLKFN